VAPALIHLVQAGAVVLQQPRWAPHLVLDDHPLNSAAAAAAVAAAAVAVAAAAAAASASDAGAFGEVQLALVSWS